MTIFITRTTKRLPACALALALFATACGTSSNADSNSPTTVGTAASPDGGSSAFTAEVWADNWFALYITGVLVGEDSGTR